jgi:glyoxylate/hydroxypyruvate reductase A
MMALLILMPERDPAELVAGLAQLDADLEVRVWPDVDRPEAVEAVVAWNHPPGVLKQLPNLQLVISYGAGVDHMLQDPSLPEGVSLARIVDPQLVTDMVEYVVGAVIAWRRGWARYAELQVRAVWDPQPYSRASSVLVLGMGQLGSAVARALTSLGHKVCGWSRSPADVDGVTSVSGNDGLVAALPEADIVICLLPLTPATDQLLDHRLLARMRPGSLLLNLGRGRHIVEPDLLAGLDRGRPGAAWLDVFADEPLPSDHLFWRHPMVTMTPHVASLTDPVSAARLIMAELHRLRRGQPPLHPVDRRRGY